MNLFTKPDDTMSLDHSMFDRIRFDFAPFGQLVWYRHWLGDAQSIQYHSIDYERKIYRIYRIYSLGLILSMCV